MSTLTSSIWAVIRQDFQNLCERVITAETHIEVVEDAIVPLQVSSDSMQLQINQILSKQDDKENRLQRCNLRFIGLPRELRAKNLPPF